MNIEPTKYKAYTRKHLEELVELKKIPEHIVEDIKIVSLILPFRTNNYVLDKLINWDNIPSDPIFKINFPHKEMLQKEYYDILKKAVESGKERTEISHLLKKIHHQLNPHPGGQTTYNLPEYDGVILNGIQHKYRETVLVFPSEGQICHAFCTYCFRWAQFVGEKELKISLNDPGKLVEYIQDNEEIQEILFTGGDPMVMKANKLAKYINQLIDSDLKNLKSIRIGTKSLTYWPYRYLTDKDSKEILELFEKITEAGIHLSIIANFNHPNELRTDVFLQAVKIIQSTGAIIRTQSPILRNINDHSETWMSLIGKQVNLGMIPYYMFIPRDTGAKDYFDVPLAKAFRIYTKAYRNLSGLCRTIRGPVMSTTLGKIQVMGITNINNKSVFVLKFIQARNPKWVGKIFFAKYDPNASWLNELEPAFSKEFFYEQEISRFLAPYSEHSKKPIESRDHDSEGIATKT